MSLDTSQSKSQLLQNLDNSCGDTSCTQSTCKLGYSDAENLECQSDSDGPFRKKKRTRVDKQKRERHLIVHVPIKRWPTGERAEMDEDAMMFDVAEEARKEMLIAGLFYQS